MRTQHFTVEAGWGGACLITLYTVRSFSPVVPNLGVGPSYKESQVKSEGPWDD